MIDYSENYVSSYTDERGKVTSYQFNQTTGNIEKVTDANNTETAYTYKPNTSQIESVTTNNSKVNYTYTDLGLVETISHNTTDNNDVVYTFTYDEFGNVSSIKVGNRTLAIYAYGEKNGTLNSTTYGTNEKISYSYDSLERVTGIYENDVLKYSWEYGSDGRIGRFVDHNTDGTIKYRGTKFLTVIPKGNTCNIEVGPFRDITIEDATGANVSIKDQSSSKFKWFTQDGDIITIKGELGTDGNTTLTFGGVPFSDILTDNKDDIELSCTYDPDLKVTQVNSCVVKKSGLTLTLLNSN